MLRQHREVQHVGVGEQVARVLADPPALLGRGVAVDHRRPHVGAEGGDRGQLVGGQRLGRRDVQDPGPGEHPAALEQPGQGGQLVRQRLAGGRAGGHHDVPSGAHQLGDLHLVTPRALDAAAAPARHELRVRPGRPVGGAAGARRRAVDVPHPVAATRRRRAGRRGRRRPERRRRCRRGAGRRSPGDPRTARRHTRVAPGRSRVAPGSRSRAGSRRRVPPGGVPVRPADG